MRYITDLTQVSDKSTPTAVALGVFDGVHLGHQALLGEMVRQAREKGLRTTVVTFYPHPKVVLQGLSGRLYLSTLAERAERLQACGIDEVVIYPFTTETRQTRAAEFVAQMQSNLNMKQIWSGDFGFGYKREGTADYLRQLGSEQDFTVHHYDEKLYINEKRVSSSRIRSRLEEGNMGDATDSLGRPYAIHGEVVVGDKRGRTIGFPTANMSVWDELIVPAYGVYASEVTVDGKTYPAATNLGVRPTVDGLNLRIEPHLLDFSGDLYGKTISLAFIERIRPEKKFNGLDELKAQIAADVAQVRSILGLAVETV